MSVVLKISLACSFAAASAWFGGYVLWLWLVSVGLPSTGTEVAYQAAIGIEAARGDFGPPMAMALTVFTFTAATVLSWLDDRKSAAILLGICASVQVLMLLVLVGLDPAAIDLAGWDEYGALEAAISALTVLLSTGVLVLTGISIWIAARSHFLTMD